MSGGRCDFIADASFDHEAGMAAVGVAFKGGGQIVCGDTIRARDANDAEFMAVIRACQMLAARQAAPGSRVYTDSHTVVHLTTQSKGDRYGCAAELRKMLADHSWHLIETNRRGVSGAHTIAREILQTWRAGRSHGATWTRTPYFKDRVPVMARTCKYDSPRAA